MKKAKQYTMSGRRVFVAMLFLLFNLVCVAAPVIKVAGDNLSGGLPSRLVEVPKSSETEETNHLTASSYFNQVHQFSLRRQNQKQAFKEYNDFRVVAANLMPCHSTYILKTEGLPLPGCYCFLFLYNLF